MALGNLSRSFIDGYSVTLLPNGKVLLMSGGSTTSGSAVVDGELFDPAMGKWTKSAPMLHTRSYHTATLRLNGSVLVVGGYTLPVVLGGPQELASTELYDYTSNTVTIGSSMSTVRAQQTATLLAVGAVLVVGGTEPSSPVELYW